MNTAVERFCCLSFFAGRSSSPGHCLCDCGRHWQVSGFCITVTATNSCLNHVKDDEDKSTYYNTMVYVEFCRPLMPLFGMRHAWCVLCDTLCDVLCGTLCDVSQNCLLLVCVTHGERCVTRCVTGCVTSRKTSMRKIRRNFIRYFSIVIVML